MKKKLIPDWKGLENCWEQVERMNYCISGIIMAEQILWIRIININIISWKTKGNGYARFGGGGGATVFCSKCCGIFGRLEVE